MLKVRSISQFKFIKKSGKLNLPKPEINPKKYELTAREACLNTYSPYTSDVYTPPNYSKKYTPSDNYRFSKHGNRYN